MGLDVTAVSNAKRVGPLSDEKLEELYRPVYVNDSFASHADGLESGFYDGLEELDFRAGSYSGYNWWREKLAEFAGYPAKGRAHDLPFYELINFSDCEGVIGPETSEKLAKQFEAHMARAHAEIDDECWLAVYHRFARAFDIAAHDGFVSFH